MRCALCWVMLVLVPPALLGQAPSAILHTQGGVWINNYEAKDSTAVFQGDVLETRVGFTANLTLEGSELSIQQESVTKFEGDLLDLEHGAVAVGTSRSFRVRVKCINVTPVANEWTQYEVSDVNGIVHVAARKSDVNVHFEGGYRKPTGENAGSQGGSVREGEEKNYSESDVCGAPPRKGGVTAIDPKWIAIGAGGAGVLIWVAIHGGGGNHPPMSSAKP